MSAFKSNIILLAAVLLLACAPSTLQDCPAPSDIGMMVGQVLYNGQALATIMQGTMPDTITVSVRGMQVYTVTLDEQTKSEMQMVMGYGSSMGYTDVIGRSAAFNILAKISAGPNNSINYDFDGQHAQSQC